MSNEPGESSEVSNEPERRLHSVSLCVCVRAVVVVVVVAAHSCFRRRHGGLTKKREVENFTNDTPPEKGFWTSRTVRFPPASGVSVLFFL